MVKMSMRPFLLGCAIFVCAAPVHAQLRAPVAGKLEEAINLCHIGMRSGALNLPERDAKAAGFTHDTARNVWNWGQGGDMVAVKSRGFDCDILIIGPSAEADATSEHLAAWGKANGFDLDRYNPILAMDALLDGSNGGTFLELKKAPNGILVLTLSQEGV